MAPPQTAQALAGSLVRKNPGELRTVVVPTLVSGLRQEGAPPAERLAYIQALARLGPAAREAVPVLANILKQSHDPIEQQAAVYALGQLGPTAEQALPVLVEATRSTAPEVNKSAVEALLNHGPGGLVAVRDLQEKGEGVQKRLAQDALHRYTPQCACVGVKDCCEMFTLQTITETQNDLLSLARSRGLAVYVETVTEQDAKAKDRDKEVETLLLNESIHLRIHKAPLRVEIRIPESLRKAKLTPAREKELRTLVERHLKAKEYDQALRAVAHFLTETAGK
jgi:hypothetical protein